jgi:toxin ParE1/3/4
MRRYEVSFRPQAEADLLDLYRYIAQEAGTRVAGSYLARIEAACLALENFPERGRRRDDILPGLRIFGFERRATIAFQVLEVEVVIVRIFYGGRDYQTALRRKHEE